MPIGTTYVESGMVVTSFSDNASVGYDPLTWNPTGGALYLHGTNQYVEFRMANQSTFNLNSFDFMTNIGPLDSRWIATSTGWSEPLPSVHLQTLNFTGPNYSNINWFRVGTSDWATELDNVNFTATPEPSTYILLSIALGAVGFARKKMNKKA